MRKGRKAQAGRIRHCVTAIAVAALAAVLVSGCTDSSAGRLPAGSHQALAPADTGPKLTSTGPFPGNRGIHVVQKAGTIPSELLPSRWTALGLDRTKRSFELEWTRGACEKKNLEIDIYVEQSTSAVVVDVYDDPTIHLPPGYNGCAAVGVIATHAVALSAPLGSRRLLEHEVVSKEREPGTATERRSGAGARPTSNETRPASGRSR